MSLPNDPAYPVRTREQHGDSVDASGEHWQHVGLTTRQRFVLAAMQAIASNPAMVDSCTETVLLWVAARSCEMADATLRAERESRC